jgi:hypothetical protein
VGRHRTPDEKRELGEQARALRAAGLSRREIAAELDISDDLAKALVAGVPLPDRLRRPRAKDDVRAAAVQMRLAGAIYDDIAAELGVSKSSCSLWLRDVSTQPDGSPPTDDVLAVTRPVDVGVACGTSADRVAARRAEARRLRLEGRLLKEIAEALGVSVKTAYYDTIGLPIPPRGRPRGRSPEELKADLRAYWDRKVKRRQAERERGEEEAAAKVGPISREALHLMAVTAYWCEGTKSKPYAVREQVTFINSDVGLIRLWLTYLDDIGFPDEHRKFNVAIHESADLVAAQTSWAADIGIPVTHLGKPTIKRHNPKTVRHNTGEDYRGCLVVRLTQCAELYRRIAGTWTGIMGALPDV